MSAESVVSFERVAEVADSMLAKGVNPTVDAVIAITGGRRDYVRRHLKAWRDKINGERKALITAALNEKFAIVLFRDREEFSRSQNTLLQEEVDSLENDCTSMEREISALHAERDDLKDLLGMEREGYEEKVKTLDQGILQLNFNLQSTQEKINKLQSELDTAKKQRDDAVKKLLGLRETHLLRSAEAKAATSKVNSLRQEMEEAKTERDKAKANLEGSEKVSKLLQGQISTLTSLVEQLREKLSTESLLRLKSELLFDNEKLRADKIEKDLATLLEKKSLQRSPGGKKSGKSNNSAPITATSP